MDESSKLKVIVYSVAAILALVVFIIVNPFVVVNAGHRGVVLEFGKVQDTVLDEGIHWRTPIVQTVKEIDVRERKYEVPLAVYSQDNQNVDVAVSVNYKLDSERVNSLYQQVGLEYEVVLMLPAVQEEVKTVLARYASDQILSNRATIKEEVMAKVRERLAPYNIIVTNVSMEDYSFSDQYEASIEAKQIAEQSALKAQNDLERVEFEAQQRIEQAKAEAEAIRIQAEAITQQGGEDYVRLKTIEQWNGQGCTQYCGLETSTGLLITR